MVEVVSFRRLILLAYTLDTNAILYYLKDDAKGISLLREIFVVLPSAVSRLTAMQDSRPDHEIHFVESRFMPDPEPPRARPAPRRKRPKVLVEQRLGSLGLQLSPTKTRIVSSDKAFPFWGL